VNRSKQNRNPLQSIPFQSITEQASQLSAKVRLPASTESNATGLQNSAGSKPEFNEAKQRTQSQGLKTSVIETTGKSPSQITVRRVIEKYGKCTDKKRIEQDRDHSH
jgi:hypothetical protein